MSIVNLTHEDEIISSYLKMYNAKYNTGTQEVTITCICDGTLNFLSQMGKFLAEIGCYEIDCEEDINEKYGTEDKPWATCKFTVTGKIPRELVTETNYEETKAHPEPIWGTCITCPYRYKCEYTTLTPDLRGESCQYYSLAERFGEHE